MAHQNIVAKKLYLRFKGSDRLIETLIIAHPEDELKKDSANIAMESIIGANLFEKDGVQLYEGRRDAYYKTRRVDVFFYNNK